MKLTTTLVLAAVQCNLITASLDPRVPEFSDASRHHARELAPSLVAHALVPRDDPHDRGTFNLDCTKAQQACNNACWSINCLGQDTKKSYYDPGDNNNHNRQQSGCNAPTSVCNLMPFSQKFNDPQGLSQPSCDEWPMAETKQQDYADRSPNSLRCIETGDNGSAGSQLSNFLDLRTNQPGRIGTQPFADGDYWVTEFQNTDNSPYCSATQGSSSCTNDGFQFQLEKLGNGISKEYDYANNNQYALTGEDASSNINIVQCRVHLHRSESSTGNKFKRAPLVEPIPPEEEITFAAEVFDYQGNSKGTQTGVPDTDTPITVTGLTSDVKIFSTGDDLNDDAKYEVDNVDWASSEVGAGGAYCSVGAVDRDNGIQDEDCYFPCFITAPE